MYMCRTVGDDGMDWGQAGEKRKRPLCYIRSTGIGLVWGSVVLRVDCGYERGLARTPVLWEQDLWTWAARPPAITTIPVSLSPPAGFG